MPSPFKKNTRQRRSQYDRSQYDRSQYDRSQYAGKHIDRPAGQRAIHKHPAKLTILALLLAFAMLLSYVESLIPFFFGVPGMKLGLANLAVVLVLYLYDPRDAIRINIMRVILTGFMFGNLYSLFFAMAGALCSFLIMVILRKTGFFSITGVSMAGGVFHNIGQALLAMWIIDTKAILFYLPALLAAGVVTGGLTGTAVSVMLPHILSARFNRLP